MGDYRPKIEQRILRQLLRAFMLLCFALLQTSLAPTFWRFRIDWVLIVVVGWTILRGMLPGLRWALYGGLALDMLGTLPVGSHLLALLLCVVTVAFLAEPLDREQPLLVLVCMLVASLIYGVTLALVLPLAGEPVPWQRYLLVVVVPATLINTIVAIPTFALLRRLHRRGRAIITI